MKKFKQFTEAYQSNLENVINKFLKNNDVEIIYFNSSHLISSSGNILYCVDIIYQESKKSLI